MKRIYITVRFNINNVIFIGTLEEDNNGDVYIKISDDNGVYQKLYSGSIRDKDEIISEMEDFINEKFSLI